jgi:hypothetical protein
MLTVHPRCQDDIDDLDYDIDDILALLGACDLSELQKHGPDDKGRPDWIAVLRIQPAGEPVPFYVKVALAMPELSRGRLLSFKIRS